MISTGKSSREQIIGVKNPDNNNVKWIMGDHEPEFDESGKLSKIIVTLVDVTDRKNAEKALRERKNNISAFLKVIPDMFFLFERNGNLIYNYLEDALIPSHIKAGFFGKNIKDMEFVDEHTADYAFQNIKKLFETGEIQTFEFSSKESSNDVFFETRFCLYGDNMVLAVVRDISKRKKLEANQ